MSRYGSYVSDTLLQMEHFTEGGKSELKPGFWVFTNRVITDDLSAKHKPLFHFLSTVGKPQATVLKNRAEQKLNSRPIPYCFFSLCVMSRDTS